MIVPIIVPLVKFSLETREQQLPLSRIQASDRRQGRGWTEKDQLLVDKVPEVDSARVLLVELDPWQPQLLPPLALLHPVGEPLLPLIHGFLAEGEQNAVVVRSPVVLEPRQTGARHTQPSEWVNLEPATDIATMDCY